MPFCALEEPQQQDPPVCISGLQKGQQEEQKGNAQGKKQHLGTKVVCGQSHMTDLQGHRGCFKEVIYNVFTLFEKQRSYIYCLLGLNLLAKYSLAVEVPAICSLRR